MSLPAGGGIAWVENARGLLLHRVRLAHGCVQRLLHRRADRMELPPRAVRWRPRCWARRRPTSMPWSSAPRGWCIRWTPAWPAASRSTMHEMSLAENMRDIVNGTARANQARRA